MRWPNFLPQLPLRSDYLNAIKTYFDELILQRFKQTILSKTFGIVPGYPSINKEFEITLQDSQLLTIKKGLAIDSSNRIILLDQDITIGFNFTNDSFPLSSYKDCYIYVYYNEENDTSVVDYDTNGNPLYPYVKVESLLHFKLDTPEVQDTYILVAHTKLYKDDQGNIFVDSFDNAANSRIYSVINMYALFNNQLINFQDHINQHGHGIVSSTNPHGLSLEDLGVEIVINHVVNKNGLILPYVNTNNSGFYFTFHSDTIKTNNYIDIYPLNEDEIVFLNRVVYSRSDLDISDIDFNNGYVRLWIQDTTPNNTYYYIKGQRNPTNNKLSISFDSTPFKDTDLAIGTFKLDSGGKIDPFSIKDNRNIGFVDANTIDPVTNVGYVWGLNTAKGNRTQKMFYVKVASDLDINQSSFTVNGTLTIRTPHFDNAYNLNDLEYHVYSYANHQLGNLVDSGSWVTKVGSTINLSNKVWNGVGEWWLTIEGEIKFPTNFPNPTMLRITTDDGARLTIGGVTYLDALFDQSTTQYLVAIPWENDKWYSFKLDHYEVILPESERLYVEYQDNVNIFHSLYVNSNTRYLKYIDIPYVFNNNSLWEVLDTLNNSLNPYNIFVRVVDNQLVFYSYNYLEIVNDSTNNLFSSSKLGKYEEYEIIKRIEYTGDGIVGKEIVGNFSKENFYWTEFYYDSNYNLISTKTNLKDKSFQISPQYYNDSIININETFI